MNFSYNQLHAFVRANAFTYQYLSPSLGVYLIKSKASVAELVDAYRGFFDGAHFFIAQIYPQLTGGALPQAVWDWVNASDPPPLISNQNA
ncbi:MAG: hypothetical protein ABWX67_10825 [Allosphingosinicella sp.]